MASLAGATPAGPSGLNRTGVVAVEKIRASRKRSEVLGFNSVDNYQERGAVGVLAAVSEPDRLHDGVSVTSRAVR
jgi:hypothetical protein